MGETLNQLAERGIPVITALADHFKVPETAIREMVTAGKVSFDDMMASMQALAGEGGKMGGLMGEQAQTLAGRWSTLKDKFIDLALVVGDQLIPVLEKLLFVGMVAIEWLGNLDRAALKQIITIGVMVKTLGFMISIFPQIVAGIRAVVSTLGVFTAASLAANAAAMNFAGVAIALGVIAASGIATMVAFDALDESIQDAENSVNGIVDSNNKLRDSAAGTSKIGQIANQNTDAIKTETSAVKELNSELDKTERKPITVAVRGSAAEFSARQRAANALERVQRAQLKAQEAANKHLEAIKVNTEKPLAAAGI